MAETADHGLQDCFRPGIRLIHQTDSQSTGFLVDGIIHPAVEYFVQAIGGNLGIQRYGIAYFVEPFRIELCMTCHGVSSDSAMTVVVDIYLNHDLGFDRSDFNLGEGLTMTLAFPIVGFCSVFENKDLIGFALFCNLGGYFSACNSRSPYFYIAIVDYSQDIIENDFLAFFNVQFFNVQYIAFADAVLFATCTDNSVHICTSLIQDSPDAVTPYGVLRNLSVR